MKRNLTASLMLLLTAMVWGFSVVAQVLGADHLPAMTFNGTRFLLGAVCLIPVYLVAEREQDLDKAARRTRHIKTARAALGRADACLLSHPPCSKPARVSSGIPARPALLRDCIPS